MEAVIKYINLEMSYIYPQKYFFNYQKPRFCQIVTNFNTLYFDPLISFLTDINYISVMATAVLFFSLYNQKIRNTVSVKSRSLIIALSYFV